MSSIDAPRAAGQVFCPTRLSTPSEIVRKTSLCSMPILCLAGASVIAGAQALSFMDCVDHCENDDPQRPHIAKLICYAICLVFAED